MPAPRKRAAKAPADGENAAAGDEAPAVDIGDLSHRTVTPTVASGDPAPTDIDIGDLSHLDEAAARGYVGELGDEGTNPHRQDED